MIFSKSSAVIVPASRSCAAFAGYAQIAGLPPTAGLYALIVPTIIFVAVTSSRHVVASPDAAAAALVASSVGGLAVAGSDQYLVMAMAQAIISGIAFVVMAVFRLGFLANFLSAPILVGFVAGLALDILVSQIAKMLGVPIASGSEFIEKLVQLVEGLPQLNVWALCISAGSLVILLVGRRWLRVAPWALVVIVVSTVVVSITDADQAGVDVLGEVTGGLPTLTWPILDWGTWIALVPSALALTLVTVAEGLLLSRSYGERHRYRTDPNRDLLAFGLTNIAGGASGSFAIGSSTSRSAAMEQAGARSQLPSLVTAAGHAPGRHDCRNRRCVRSCPDQCHATRGIRTGRCSRRGRGRRRDPRDGGAGHDHGSRRGDPAACGTLVLRERRELRRGRQGERRRRRHSRLPRRDRPGIGHGCRRDSRRGDDGTAGLVGSARYPARLQSAQRTPAPPVPSARDHLGRARVCHQP